MLELDGNTGVSLLQDNTVSTNKIVDSAVTAAKLATAAIGAAAPQRVMLMAAKATTSGTAVDFSPADGTGIPIWAKKITIQFAGVSTNGTSHPIVQVGSGALQTASYNAGGSFNGATNGAATYTTGFGVASGAAANIISGHMLITLQAGNKWVASHVMTAGAGASVIGGGDVTLSGTLDRIRITTVNGTDAFDAGNVSLLIEG